MVLAASARASAVRRSTKIVSIARAILPTIGMDATPWWESVMGIS